MFEEIYAMTVEQQALIDSYMAQIQTILIRFNRWMTVIEILEITALILSVAALVYLIVITRPWKARRKGGRHG